jgi:hypothetical protein
MSTIIQMGRHLLSGDFRIILRQETTHFLREEERRRTLYEDLQAIVDISLEKSLFSDDAANVSITILEYISYANALERETSNEAVKLSMESSGRNRP